MQHISNTKTQAHESEFSVLHDFGKGVFLQLILQRCASSRRWCLVAKRGLPAARIPLQKLPFQWCLKGLGGEGKKGRRSTGASPWKGLKEASKNLKLKGVFVKFRGVEPWGPTNLQAQRCNNKKRASAIRLLNDLRFGSKFLARLLQGIQALPKCGGGIFCVAEKNWENTGRNKI